MDELVRWLGEQLDEDERIAWDACGPGNRWYGADSGGPVHTQEDRDTAHVEAWKPARVLREIDAKRQIVDRYAWLREHGDTGGTAWVLPLLALPYADRPGYREEWRP